MDLVNSDDPENLTLKSSFIISEGSLLGSILEILTNLSEKLFALVITILFYLHKYVRKTLLFFSLQFFLKNTIVNKTTKCFKLPPFPFLHQFPPPPPPPKKEFQALIANLH